MDKRIIITRGKYLISMDSHIFNSEYNLSVVKQIIYDVIEQLDVDHKREKKTIALEYNEMQQYWIEETRSNEKIITDLQKEIESLKKKKGLFSIF